jgi:hypothetical protein
MLDCRLTRSHGGRSAAGPVKALQAVGNRIVDLEGLVSVQAREHGVQRRGEDVDAAGAANVAAGRGQRRRGRVVAVVVIVQVGLEHQLGGVLQQHGGLAGAKLRRRHRSHVGGHRADHLGLVDRGLRARGARPRVDRGRGKCGNNGEHVHLLKSRLLAELAVLSVVLGRLWVVVEEWAGGHGHHCGIHLLC